MSSDSRRIPTTILIANEPPPSNDANDPLDALRLQGRAQSVFARAARMQELHGQAQLFALGQAATARQTLPPHQRTDAGAAGLMEQSALNEMADTHALLLRAARAAGAMASTDVQISRLNALIHGGPAVAETFPRAGQVVDVDATEVVQADGSVQHADAVVKLPEV